MQRLLWILPALGLALMSWGCILTSGQIQIGFDLPSGSTNSALGIFGFPIDLSVDEDYDKHKDKLKGITDQAILGRFTNNVGAPVDVELWMTPGATFHVTEAALKADPTARHLWGPFALGAAGSPTETRTTNWDRSAALFSTAGKAALLNEAKNDGTFTLYVVGAPAPYNFSLSNGALVLVLDAGI